jgi:hypothetical protein
MTKQVLHNQSGKAMHTAVSFMLDFHGFKSQPRGNSRKGQEHGFAAMLLTTATLVMIILGGT